MSRNNFGLTPIVRQPCPNCGTILQIWQRWVEGESKDSPPCPACGETFRKADDGKRTDSHTGKKYTQSKKIEIVRVRLAHLDKDD